MYTIEEVKNILTVLDKVSNDVKVVGISFLNSADTNGNTILHQSVKNKDLITIQLICDLISKTDKDTKSKLLDAQNKDGNTALHLAVQLCQIKNNPESIMWEAMAKILDNAGTNKNIQNKAGESVIPDVPNTTGSPQSPKSVMSEYQMNLFT